MTDKPQTPDLTITQKVEEAAPEAPKGPTQEELLADILKALKK